MQIMRQALPARNESAGEVCLATSVVSHERSTAVERSVAIPARAPLRAVMVTARPRQWLKNLLVIAAAGAAGALGHDDVPVRVGLACAAFCMLA